MEYSRDYKLKYANFVSKLRPKVSVTVMVVICTFVGEWVEL